MVSMPSSGLIHFYTDDPEIIEQLDCVNALKRADSFLREQRQSISMLQKCVNALKRADSFLLIL